MPELPEVETVKNKLYPYVVGKTILNCDIYYDKHNCLKEIKNQTINDIQRKGKYLIFVLDDYYMISHLRMEGKYFIRNDDVVNKHDLVRFNFEDFHLVYNDVRKFGIFCLFNKDEDIYNLPPLTEVGDEPFYIKEDELYKTLQSKRDFIKPTLLDQKVMAGLGNIYVDEVLYFSKINPYRKANTITKEETKLIINNSIDVLNRAIKAGGSTIKSFKSINSEIGHFQLSLKCHNHENDRCEVCRNIIMKDRCGGRGTYYCPSCQRINPNQKIYALTGTFSSGKSTALSIIKELGYQTFSCDDIYNELFKENESMLKEIKKALKVETKEEIRNKVFNNEENNKILMSITHKYVTKELFNRIYESKANIVFVEVPLLFEGGFEKTFDKIIDIHESEEVSLKLIKAKGFTKEEADKRFKSQYSREYKKEHSDYVIENDSTLDNLKNKIKELIKILEV